MKTNTLRFKVTALACFFMVFIMTIVFTMLSVLHSQSHDAEIIDIGGRQRMLSQKMTKEALVLKALLESGAYADTQRKRLTATIDLFDKSLTALKDGGITMGTDGKETTLPESRGTFNLQLQKVSDIWGPFKKFIMAIVDPAVDITSRAFQNSATEIEKGNIPLLMESNKAVVLVKEESERKTALLKVIMIASLLLTAVLGVASIVLINRLVIKPIAKTAEIMERVSNKDFTKLLKFKSNDEIGKMGQAVNRMVTTLNNLFHQISDSTNKMTVSSERFAETAASLAAGADDENLKAAHVATASLEMSATIIDVAKNASGVADVAKEANEVASKGGQIVSRTIESMNAIVESTRRSSAVIETLSSRSQEIGNIIDVIFEIAEQTNLLALNAAIEAARAGDQGRGFAVVADEVRKLAEKTRAATKEIGETMKLIQSDTDEALKSAGEDVRAVEDGVHLARNAGAALEDIMKKAEEVSSMIVQIATATEEQSSAADEISRDIESVASLIKEEWSDAKTIALASQEMFQLSFVLRDMLADFRLSEESSADGCAADNKEALMQQTFALDIGSDN